MDERGIARALKDPLLRETGERQLVRELGQRYWRSGRELLAGCSRSVTPDDLLARVLEKVVSCIDQYEERGSFWGWVHRIVINEAHELRRQDPEHAVPPGLAANAPFLCAVHSMLNGNGSATHRGWIREAFRSLSRRDQSLLKRTARYWPEKPPDRVIARGLGIPEMLVRRYRYVAVRRFRQALERIGAKRHVVGTAEEPRFP